MTNQGKRSLLMMMDLDPQDGEEFNVWDNEEHVPKPISIPCFVGGNRYQILLIQIQRKLLKCKTRWL